MDDWIAFPGLMWVQVSNKRSCGGLTKVTGLVEWLEVYECEVIIAHQGIQSILERFI